MGAEVIIAGVFHRLGTEWIGYKAEVHTFLEDGDKVAAFGTYSGTYKATGKSTRAEFAHLSPSAVTLPNKWSGWAWV